MRLPYPNKLITIDEEVKFILLTYTIKKQIRIIHDEIFGVRVFLD